MHVCWGNYEGPHHRDVPLADIHVAQWRKSEYATLREAIQATLQNNEADLRLSRF